MTDVLVVDDEDEIITMLKRNLELEDYTVDGANDRESAIEAMETNLYPIVLLDIKFPNTSGPELLDILNDINPPCSRL